MLGARRRAFTLVELLLVIGIILVLAALAAAAYPDISLGVRAAGGADRLQSWLLNAKMRAKRDGRPTGLRLITFTPTGTFVFCNQMMYVQQPDDYAQGRCTGLTTPAVNGGGRDLAARAITGRTDRSRRRRVARPSGCGT